MCPLSSPSPRPCSETAGSVSAALGLVNPTSRGLIVEAARLHVSDEFGQIDVSLEARSACFTSDQTGGGGGTVDGGGGGGVDRGRRPIALSICSAEVCRDSTLQGGG